MADLERAKYKLEEEVHDLKTEIEWNRQHTVEKHKLLLCEQKLKDTENRLELETAHKLRLEVYYFYSKKNEILVDSCEADR